jgi:RNA polymerase sigma-70 factor (ECF subfamily)
MDDLMIPPPGSAVPLDAPQVVDEPLLSSGAVGDALVSSFERLTMPHLPAISRFARSLTREAAAADDLVQETYLRALRGWHTFRDGSDARRWLFAICHHAFLRDVQREGLYVQPPDDDPELESLETVAAHWRAQQSGVADAAERLDLGQAINRAVGTLSPHYRAAVVLVDVEGQTYEEAAEVLGIPVGTVRSRLFRGRRMLQDLLFEYARDAGFDTTRTPAPPEARK